MRHSSRQSLREPILSQQRLLRPQCPRPIPDLCVDQALHRARLELLRHSLIEALHYLSLNTRLPKQPKHILEPVALREVLHHQLHNLLHVLLQRIDDRIRARVVRIRRPPPQALLHAHAVVLHNQSDDGPAHVVHIKDGRLRVERDGMELVRVRHRHLCERIKVPALDRRGYSGHALGHDVGDAVLEEGRGLDGALHAAGGGGALFVIGDDADEGVHVGPVGLWCDLDGERVLSVGARALFPGDEAAVERAAGRAGALACDEGERGGGDGERIKLGEGGDEGGEAGGGGREASGGGEVVVGGDVDVV
ncbi:hypothetical protein D9615_002600 [Tricholomella constricta]|uniref:Uncharacterized protein n=1 Tax=Tricholomella constricta TaxID=117010 RepID=A0A8H5HM05_9AGAR|nr:hypothetical protein D9615_002600 [Tricholomella constricta]